MVWDDNQTCIHECMYTIVGAQPGTPQRGAIIIHARDQPDRYLVRIGDSCPIFEVEFSSRANQQVVIASHRQSCESYFAHLSSAMNASPIPRIAGVGRGERTDRTTPARHCSVAG